MKDQTGITELAAAKNISLKDAADQVANAENGRMGGLVKLGVVTKEEVKDGISMDEINKRLNSIGIFQSLQQVLEWYYFRLLQGWQLCLHLLLLL